MPKFLMQPTKILLLICVLAIAGCKEVLYSSLGELQSAEIMRVLQHNNISATRTRDKDGLYTINVSNKVFGVAVTALNEAGLPKARFKSMEDMFPADSIVGTPFEEKARYSFALSQELSATLSEISGVHSARVHIVIPEQDRFEKDKALSAASIAIYHTRKFDQNSFVPKIKSLIANAVPDLVYDNVVIALFPVQAMPNYVVPDSSSKDGAQANPQGDMVFMPGGSNEQMKANLILLAFALGILAMILSMFRKIWLWVRPSS